MNAFDKYRGTLLGMDFKTRDKIKNNIIEIVGVIK
jgi:hypothetical protein